MADRKTEAAGGNAKRILVTGSTDGIGLATAVELARQGHEVIIHGRNEERVRHATQQLWERAPEAAVEAVIGDFSSLQQVRRVAEAVLANSDRLDALINNAAVLTRERRASHDGYELTWAVNHLAPFLLTNLLLGMLKQSAPSRVINVSSMSHTSGRINFEDLNMEESYDGYEAYAASKLANIVFTYELARRTTRLGVSANALTPGVVRTKLLHVYFSGGVSTEEGAVTCVYLAASPDVENVSGAYFSDCKRVKSSPLSHDQGLAEQLWDASSKMVGLR
ncbi:MAG: SDR family oxidoreductase [Spirochaetaceae bacterium]|nr:MAG: SDR family oxidoreductase [Spirochaetaceae bacterium]